MNKNSFFAIEGIDGTGKSTIAKMLEERLGAIKLSRKKSNSLVSKIQELKNNKASEEELHHLYLEALLETSASVEKSLSNNHVVVARWLGTEVAAHKIYATKNGGKAAKIGYKKLGILVPDYVILLTADAEVRKARMAVRGKLGKNDLASLENGCQGWVIKETYKLYKGVIEIDTSKKTPDEVVDAIIAELPCTFTG